MIDEVYLDMDGVLTNWDYQIDFYNARKPTGKADRIPSLKLYFFCNSRMPR